MNLESTPASIKLLLQHVLDSQPTATGLQTETGLKFDRVWLQARRGANSGGTGCGPAPPPARLSPDPLLAVQGTVKSKLVNTVTIDDGTGGVCTSGMP